MAEDEIITSKTITTVRWLQMIKSPLEDFAADRDAQEKAWLSGSSEIRSPTEIICTLMNDFSFRSIVAQPSSRELADLSEAQRASCSRFSDLVTAFVRHKKGIFDEEDVINDPEWDKIRIAAKALFKELYP